MSLYQSNLSHIDENRDRRLTGSFNCIPMEGMSRLKHHIPGVQRLHTIVTANSGIGKTKLIKALWLLKPLEFIRNNPNAQLDMRTQYFCLEESKEKFMDTIIVYQLWKRKGWRVPYKDLISVRDILSQEQRDFLHTDEMLEWFEWFEERVQIIDNVYHPYGIFKKAEELLLQNGHWEMRPYEYEDDRGNTRNGMARDKYISHTPGVYYQVIIDNYNVLRPEKGKNKYESIDMMANTYVPDLRDKYKCAVTAGQQQASDQEKKQFTSKGQSIESKLEPSLDGLGDCKLTQRSADEVYGLFAPDRYEIREHRGYNINLLEDNYRSFSFLKGRDMDPNYKMPFFFDGEVGDIVELPKASTMTDDSHYAPWVQRVGRGVGDQQMLRLGR